MRQRERVARIAEFRIPGNKMVSGSGANDHDRTAYFNDLHGLTKGNDLLTANGSSRPKFTVNPHATDSLRVAD
jgi:hypothetical protein